MAEPVDDQERESDAVLLARGRALASPLRMRILRLCLHEAHTNKELAEELGLNPGTMLHHVRSLVTNGLLIAEEPRRGTRGAKEVPYRATGRSWRSGGSGMGPVLVDTFLQEIEGVDPEDLHIIRLGVKLNEESLAELRTRFVALFEEFKDRGPDADGTPFSLMFAEHPELRRGTTTPR